MREQTFELIVCRVTKIKTECMLAQHDSAVVYRFLTSVSQKWNHINFDDNDGDIIYQDKDERKKHLT